MNSTDFLIDAGVRGGELAAGECGTLLHARQFVVGWPGSFRMGWLVDADAVASARLVHMERHLATRQAWSPS